MANEDDEKLYDEFTRQACARRDSRPAMNAAARDALYDIAKPFRARGVDRELLEMAGRDLCRFLAVIETRELPDHAEIAPGVFVEHDTLLDMDEKTMRAIIGDEAFDANVEGARRVIDRALAEHAKQAAGAALPRPPAP